MNRKCILIANELPLHREVLAGTLKSLRPGLCIHTTSPADIDDVGDCREPRLIICSDVAVIQRKRPYAWILLFPDEQDVVRFGVGATMRTLMHATMDDLLLVIDEALGDPSPDAVPVNAPV